MAPRRAKIILKNDKVKGLTYPNFRTYYQAIIIKLVWYWHLNRRIGQQNRMESPEINPCRFGQLTFDGSTRTVRCGWGEGGIVFKKWCGATEYPHTKEYSLTPTSHHIQKLTQNGS